MSTKEEGYLHDYIAAGLAGFVVGIAIAATIVGALWGLYTTYTWPGGLKTDWGKTAAYMVVAAIFGYLPGGFFAAYLNFRLHDVEDKRNEGIMAGVVAFLCHFLITLFTTIFGTAISSMDFGITMGAWVLSFVFALFFYPIGGLIAGLVEEKRIPIPPFLRIKILPTAAPPPPPPPGAEVCPTCGGQLTYIPQYQRWYCYKCKKYA